MLVCMAKELTQDDVLEAIRKETAKSSLRKVAIDIEVSAAFLSDVLRGRRDVSDKVAEAFGFIREVRITKQVVFRRK